jgi:hypothetical protein
MLSTRFVAQIRGMPRILHDAFRSHRQRRAHHAPCFVSGSSRSVNRMPLFVLALLKLFIPPLLPLALKRPNQFRRRILNQLALLALIEARPLGQPIGHIHHPLSIKHVTAGFEVRAILVVLEVDEGGEDEDHVAPLVHDGRVAVGAADLAGELVLGRLGGGVVPLEVVVAVGEVDVGFVEDGGPLEGGGYASER